MSETKFTPGPWTAERLRLDGHEWFVKSECRELPPCNWKPRLTVPLDPLRPLDEREYVQSRRGPGGDESGCCPLAISENKANAHLIAAAPDLYAALKEIVEDGWINLDVVSDGSDYVVLDKAKAALAKANGEPPC